MRYFTTPSVREARSSVAWSLFFIFLLYFTAPAYAAFSKLEVFTLVNSGTKLGDLPAWMYTYGKLGLVKVCGADVTTVENVLAACGKIANHPGVLRFQDLNINTDVIVLSTPEIAGMPYVIAGLVAAGGLAAALSTADGLLLAIANALSHDIYYKMISPNASTATRLIVARILLVLVAFAAACLGVLAGSSGHLPGTRHGYLVEAGDDCRCNRRHDPRLRCLRVLPRRDTVLRRELPRTVGLARHRN